MNCILYSGLYDSSNSCIQTMQVGKLLKYLSSLSSRTSDEPAVAEAELLANTSGITSYFQKLSGTDVSTK